jgi:DNA-binding MarR family transcriptional regulator
MAVMTRLLSRWYDQQLSMSKQLHNELSQREHSLSSPSPDRLRAWRLYVESALALVDVLDTELERDAGIPLRWYDVLVHLEETPEGLRMNELAERILYSKSGFTRVVDRMEEAGLVRRVRPENDRRSILVVLTDRGRDMIDRARRRHRAGIEQHFSRHLTDGDVKAITRALEKVTAYARPLRPGRIRS